MITIRSLVTCALVATMVLIGLAGHASAGREVAFASTTLLSNARVAIESAAASAVGTCNALTGRALGLVHRIDQGDTALCGNLVDLFNVFAGAGCLDLLNAGQLFLTDAVGQYQLACDVFINDCQTPVPPPACVFD